MAGRKGKAPTQGLGRRERELVEAVYRLGRASVSDVQAALADPPSYSSVRKTLAVLEEKGYVQHSMDGLRFIYEPAVRQEVARRSALRHMIDTFFAGSEEELVTALLTERRLSRNRLDRLAQLVDEARDRDAESRGTD